MIYLMCSFEGAIFQKSLSLNCESDWPWGLSWLERRPVTAEVVGSNPIRVVVIISPDDNLLETAYNYIWGLSSAGRASALQAEGHRFEPCRTHQFCRLGSMAEQLICNQQVVGLTPTVGSILIM